MNTPTIRVLLAFANKMPDDPLITFSNTVHEKLYQVPGFTEIPVTAEALEAGIRAFSDAKALQPSGGKAATALKNEKRDELVKLLKKLANYVQDACGNNLVILLSSGFDAVSTNRARYPLSRPMIRKIVPGMTGTALVTMTTEPVARGCQIRVAEIGPDGAPGEFRTPLFSTSSRNIVVPELTPGKEFAFQGRTVGGSTTYSDWSDLIVQRAA